MRARVAEGVSGSAKDRPPDLAEVHGRTFLRASATTASPAVISPGTRWLHSLGCGVL